jgi:hypothetical protein
MPLNNWSTTGNKQNQYARLYHAQMKSQLNKSEKRKKSIRQLSIFLLSGRLLLSRKQPVLARYCHELLIFFTLFIHILLTSCAVESASAIIKDVLLLLLLLLFH